MYGFIESWTSPDSEIMPRSRFQIKSYKRTALGCFLCLLYGFVIYNKTAHEWLASIAKERGLVLICQTVGG